MALKIAIDTNRYVDFCKGEPKIVSQVRAAKHIFIPFVVLAELRAGFLCGKKQELNIKTLSKFLNSDRTSVLFADEQTTHHYARLFSQLKKIGKPVPTNDLWIAAVVVQNDLTLSTRDKHFHYFEQIPLI